MLAAATPAWSNLGWWSGSTDYTVAAQALAMRVGEAARLGAGDVVADYACGYGDSLRLWVEAFGVARVVGLEPDPAVVDLATQRVADWGLSDRIAVRVGRAETLTPSALAAGVTAVVCVDAAYHFASRGAWVRAVANELPPDGRIAWSDLAVEDSSSWMLQAAALLVGVPRENLAPASAVLALTEAAGLTPIVAQHCGAEVLDGFVRHAPRRGLRVLVTRRLIAAARHSGALDYLVAAAQR